MKYQQLYKLSLLVLCLFAISTAAGGALRTCKDYYLDGVILHASCQYDYYIFGYPLTLWEDASINLNNCLGNNQGNFGCGLTLFSPTAQNIALSGKNLVADLGIDQTSGWHYGASINLDNVLTNNQANLVCGCAN